jgi:hypothetical protein
MSTVKEADYFLEGPIQRPRTAKEVTGHRFGVYDSSDTLLKDAVTIYADKTGQLNGLPDEWAKTKEPLIVDARAILDEGIERLCNEVLERDQYIFGLVLNAASISPESMDALAISLLSPGILNFLAQLDISCLPLSPATQQLLCRMLSPVLSGYCPVKNFVATGCALKSSGSLNICNALVGNVFIEEVFMNGNAFTDLVSRESKHIHTQYKDTTAPKP